MARVKGGYTTRRRRKKILKLANIEINRKMLSEIAIADPDGFTAIVDSAKKALAK